MKLCNVSWGAKTRETKVIDLSETSVVLTKEHSAQWDDRFENFLLKKSSIFSVRSRWSAFIACLMIEKKNKVDFYFFGEDEVTQR